MGEDEWWEDRLITSFDYRREYPNAPLSFLADAGHGHFDISDELIDYLLSFSEKGSGIPVAETFVIGYSGSVNSGRSKDWLAGRPLAKE